MQVTPEPGTFLLPAEDEPLAGPDKFVDVSGGGNGGPGLVGNTADEPPVQPPERPFSPAGLDDQPAGSGFMLKTDPPDRLVEAVRVVAAGDALLGAATTRRLIERFLAASPPNAATPAELSRLTSREFDVLKLLARGMSNVEIGSALFIGEGTVKTHVARILAKLGLRDRVQAVVYVYETGVVRPGQTEE